MQKDLRAYAGPGHWNDPDMLEVGNGMTFNEDRAHFTLWCMLAAPLIAGNDMKNMSKETISIFTNKEVVAIDQDSLGIEGYKHLNFGELEIWVKPLKNKDIAVCFFNRGDTPVKVDYDWKKFTIQDGLSGLNVNFGKETYKVRDLWAHLDKGTTKDTFKADLSAHDVVVVRLSK